MRAVIVTVFGNCSPSVKMKKLRCALIWVSLTFFQSVPVWMR